MIIKGSEFTPAPEGVHNAVCVDVVDLGMVENMWGKKHQLKVVWEIEAQMEDGRRFIVQKRYSASLHEKSTLSKDLKSWRGRAFTADELKGFDMEKVVGVACQLVVIHNEKEGAIYANIQSILKAGPTRLTPSGSYKRVKDRPADQRGATHHTSDPEKEPEEIPF
jgi:hypothetical protein